MGPYLCCDQQSFAQSWSSHVCISLRFLEQVCTLICFWIYPMCVQEISCLPGIMSGMLGPPPPTASWQSCILTQITSSCICHIPTHFAGRMPSIECAHSGLNASKRKDGGACKAAIDAATASGVEVQEVAKHELNLASDNRPHQVGLTRACMHARSTCV